MNESLFSKAVSAACAVLNVEKFYDDQYHVPKHFLLAKMYSLASILGTENH